MKTILLFLVLVLTSCASFKLDGVGTLQHLNTVTPTPSPCPDLDLSGVPPAKLKHAQEILKLLRDPALAPEDKQDLQDCLCAYLEGLTK